MRVQNKQNNLMGIIKRVQQESNYNKICCEFFCIIVQ